MASALSSNIASTFLGSWQITSDHHTNLLVIQGKEQVCMKRPIRPRPMMKNVNEGKGIFAPIVILTRNIVGKKRFNQLRGKVIALHSQVITEFCKSIGADSKQRQALIRLAKKNGERLGFLA